MEGNEHIDHHLKRALDGLSQEPHFSSFDKTMEKLRKQKRRRFFYIFFLSGIFIGASLLLADLFEPGVRNYAGDAQPVHQPVKTGKTNKHAMTEQPVDPALHQDMPPVPVAETPKVHVPLPKTASKKNFERGKQAEDKIVKLGATPKNNNAGKPTSPVEKMKENKPVNDLTPKENLPVETAKTEQVPETGGTVNENNVDPVLPVFYDSISAVKQQPDSLSTIEDPVKAVPSELSLALPHPDTLPLKKIKVPPVFFIGIAAEPQLTGNHFLENVSSPTMAGFTKKYLAQRKEQNSLRPDFSFGIRAGVLLKGKWELLAGFGYQRYKSKETIYNLTDSSTTPTTLLAYTSQYSYDPRIPGTKAAVDPNTEHENTFRLFYYSVGATRIFVLPNFMKIKAGVGLQVNQLLNASSVVVQDVNQYYYYSKSKTGPYNVFSGTVNLKAGWIEDLGSRMQLQFCPNLFYSPVSLFNKTYLVQQRPFGFGLEVLLLYRFDRSIAH